MSNEVLLRNNRQLIPRWHTSKKAFQLQFPGAKASMPPKAPALEIEKALDEWKEKKTVSSATELCVLLKNDQDFFATFQEAQHYLYENKSKLLSEARALIEPTTYQAHLKGYVTHQTQLREKIRTLKHRVRACPGDALSWLDLAFYYAAMELLDKAWDCIKIAVNLAPKHPFVIRTFSRFLIHIDEPDKALGILNRSGLIKSNPQITSAALSISTAFGIGHGHVNSARKLLNDFKGDPILLSDLAASLGTLEIKNGAIRKGKKLIARSLEHPSENASAQYQWLHHKHQITISGIDRSIIQSIEAEATDAYVAKDFVSCRSKLLELHAFQPFTDSALISAGYMSMIGAGDPQFVVDISENRLPLSQMSFIELNNLAVAKMELKASDANECFAHLSKRAPQKTDREYPTYLATLGFNLFSNGDVLGGVNAYREALELIAKKKERRNFAVAQYFFAKNLEPFSPEDAKLLFTSSKKIAEELNIYELMSSKAFKPAAAKSDQVERKLPSLHIPDGLLK